MYRRPAQWVIATVGRAEPFNGQADRDSRVSDGRDRPSSTGRAAVELILEPWDRWVYVIALIVGWRMATGRIARNWTVGIRTVQTMTDPRAWEVINAVAGRWISAGAVIALAHTGIWRNGDDVETLVRIGIVVVTVLAGAGHGQVRYGRQASGAEH